MEPLIVWTDASLVERGASREFSLDMAYGTGDSTNDFELSLPQDVRLVAGGLVHLDGTGWGGVVDRCSVDTEEGSSITWSGRTWQGILANKVLRPNSGANYLVASGAVSDCITQIIQKCSLTGLMSVGECPVETVSYQYWRYIDAWHGLVMMLASVGMRPTFTVVRTGGNVRVRVGAVSRTEREESVDSDLVDFAAVRVWRATNHLVCLGAGELSQRLVCDLYADSSGNVSQTQSYFGLDEVCETYELSSVETSEEIIAEGTKHLEELRAANTVELTVSEGLDLDVGDVVQVYDARVDLAATAQIGQVVVKVSDGIVTVLHETGSPDMIEEAR